MYDSRGLERSPASETLHNIDERTAMDVIALTHLITPRSGDCFIKRVSNSSEPSFWSHRNRDIKMELKH